MSDSPNKPPSLTPKAPKPSSQPKKPLANDFLGHRDHSNGGMVYGTPPKKTGSMIRVSKILAMRKDPSQG